MNHKAATKVLVRFAHEECAGHGVRLGTCESRNRAPCRLASGGRCGYFEESVLPIATRRLRATRTDRPRDDSRIVKAFVTLWPASRGTLIPHGDDDGRRTCPGCGAMLAPRKRYCPACAERRRREGVRARKHGQPVTR